MKDTHMQEDAYYEEEEDLFYEDDPAEYSDSPDYYDPFASSDRFDEDYSEPDEHRSRQVEKAPLKGKVRGHAPLDGALKLPDAGNTDYLDFASVICAITVVMLHTNGVFWTFSATESYWVTSNIIENTFYCAVPVFYMISATTLLDYRKRYGTGTFFKKRIQKTAIPYVFWSLMGIVTRVCYMHSITLLDVTPSYVLTRLGEGSCVGVYWFFIPLFSIYLSMPLFAAVPEQLRKSLFTYISVASFIICSAIPFVISVFSLDISTSLTIWVGAEYLFYVPTGYLLSHYEIKRPVRWILYIAGAAGLAMMILGTYVLSMQAGSIVETFKGYTNVPCILYSVGVFVFFKQVGGRLMQFRPVHAVIGVLRQYTFALYLLHWFLIQLHYYRYYPDIFSVFYRLVLPFPIIGIIIVFTWLVRKIPLVRNLLP